MRRLVRLIARGPNGQRAIRSDAHRPRIDPTVTSVRVLVALNA